MKKALLTTAMVMCAFLFMNETKAQVRFGLNINLGGRSSLGISSGNYAGNYYYYPEIDSYYDIPNRQFVYMEDGNWRSGVSLPYAYHDYDLNRGYKVVVNEARPYMHADVYRQKYSSYYNNFNRSNNRFDNNRGRQGGFNDNRQADRNGRNDHFDNNRGKQGGFNDNRQGSRNDRNDHNDKGRDNEHDRDRNPGRRG
jgi:hypothetical protein